MVTTLIAVLMAAFCISLIMGVIPAVRKIDSENRPAIVANMILMFIVMIAMSIMSFISTI